MAHPRLSCGQYSTTKRASNTWFESGCTLLETAAGRGGFYVFKSKLCK
jgi:hypothetical protein